MPALDATTAGRYLGRHNLDEGIISRLVKIAAGNWLVLELAADAIASTGAAPGNLPALYTDLLARLYTDLLARARRNAPPMWCWLCSPPPDMEQRYRSTCCAARWPGSATHCPG